MNGEPRVLHLLLLSRGTQGLSLRVPSLPPSQGHICSLGCDPCTTRWRPWAPVSGSISRKKALVLRSLGVGGARKRGVAQPVQHGRVQGSRHLQLTSNTNASPALSHGPLGHCIPPAPIPTPGPEVPRPQA